MPFVVLTWFSTIVFLFINRPLWRYCVAHGPSALRICAVHVQKKKNSCLLSVSTRNHGTRQCNVSVRVQKWLSCDNKSSSAMVTHTHREITEMMCIQLISSRWKSKKEQDRVEVPVCTGRGASENQINQKWSAIITTSAQKPFTQWLHTAHSTRTWIRLLFRIASMHWQAVENNCHNYRSVHSYPPATANIY